MLHQLTFRGNNVLSRYQPIKQSSLREELAEDLSAVQGAKSDPDVASVLGWSAQTVRNVRNRTNTLSLELMLEAAARTEGDFGGKAMALAGLRLAPLNAKCDSDPAFQTHLMAVAYKVARAIESGGTIDDDELDDMVPDLRQLAQFIDGLIARSAA
jgi:hypothetical protein